MTVDIPSCIRENIEHRMGLLGYRKKNKHILSLFMKESYRQPCS